MKALKNLGKTALPVVGGAIAAKLIKNVAGKMIANDKIRSAAPFVVGLVLSGNKNKTFAAMGSGMMAVGGADLAGAFFPALNGLEDMDLSGLNPLNGTVLNDDVLNGVNGIIDNEDWDLNY